MSQIRVAREARAVIRERQCRFRRSAGTWWERLLALSRRQQHGLRDQSGFALVIAIWSLGLIALLGTSIIIGARYRTQVESNYASVATAMVAADSAINLAILISLTAPADHLVKFPLSCRMPGGELARIAVENELGKVDLNTASPDVLARLFGALAKDQTVGTQVAARIVAFRSQTRSEDHPMSGSGPTRFSTVMQLDQIDGISPRLFRTATRYLTVHSLQSEPDRNVASSELRNYLALEPASKMAPQRVPAEDYVTFRADVAAPDGARFIREALVALRTNGQGYTIEEWRRGEIESTSLLDGRSTVKPCLATPAAVAHSSS